MASVTNHVPAQVMAALCILGGITGFIRTRSIPSIVAGVSVGTLFYWSALEMQKGNPNGLTGALAASGLLFASSLPRITKGPVPLTLTLAAASSGVYYIQAFRARGVIPRP